MRASLLLDTFCKSYWKGGVIRCLECKIRSDIVSVERFDEVQSKRIFSQKTNELRCVVPPRSFSHSTRTPTSIELPNTRFTRLRIFKRSPITAGAKKWMSAAELLDLAGRWRNNTVNARNYDVATRVLCRSNESCLLHPCHHLTAKKIS